MVLQLLSDMQEQFPYTLRDIADRVGFEKMNTVRAYLTKVLPPSCVQKKGDKRGARYNENTLNSFIVLKMLLDRKVLKKDQITAVMEALGQRQINRIALGHERLRVHIAVKGDGEESKQTRAASTAYANEQVLLVDGNEITPIGVQQDERLSVEHDPDDDWDVIPISESLQLRYRGNLTKEQQKELLIAARMLKAVVQPRSK